MRGHLIGLVLAMSATPIVAQTQQQPNLCRSPSAPVNRVIEECTALIGSGQEQSANLVLDHLNRGVAYVHVGHNDEAISDFSQAIALKPDYADAYYDRGIAYRHEGLYDQAISDYSQAIALKPDFALAYLNRGIANEDRGLFDQAIQDETKAIALKPDFAEAYNNRGSAYRQEGLYD